MNELSATEREPHGTGSPLVLLVENDPSDEFLFRRALAKAGYGGDLQVVGSVPEARAYMEKMFPYIGPLYGRQPSLIVWDFHLAGRTALDFILWLRRQPALAEIPMVMLSGVARGLDPARLAQVGARGFIQKTADATALAAALRPFVPMALP